MRVKAHAAPVFGSAWSRDGMYFATCGADKMIHLWDSRRGLDRTISIDANRKYLMMKRPRSSPLMPEHCQIVGKSLSFGGYTIRTLVLLLFIQLLNNAHTYADDWSRFRGPNGTGVSAEKTPLPAEIGPDKNLLWKTSIPGGVSSPVAAAGRVFLTTMEKGPILGTMALDASSGRILWHKKAPIVSLDKKRLASATPVTDGKLVVSFFGSSGLYCYDIDGKFQWKKWFGGLENRFGHAASPILVGDRVILVVDHDGDSFVVALDKRSGKQLWRSNRYCFGRNYASPVVCELRGRRYVVVTGTGMITGYDVTNGQPAWYSRGTCGIVNPTPVVASNGRIYVHGKSPAGNAKSSPFASVLKAHDTSGDGALQAKELPDSFLKTYFAQFDGDADGGISKQEYSKFKPRFAEPFVVGMACIKPGGLGRWNKAQLAWTIKRSMPRTPGALYHDGVLYVVNEKGVLHSIDAETGKVIRKGRISASGTVYSSPSLGDGKIYIGTRGGEVAVVSAERNWKELHTASLGGDIQSSPAIAGGRIYLRSNESLYCFGLQAGK